MDGFVWPPPRKSASMKLLTHFAFVCLLLASALALGQGPIPLIYQPLVPASAAPGGKGFTLTINGAGFTSTAQVYWNGSLRTTTVVSNSQVQAQIGASDIAQAGFGWVTVGNLGEVEVQSNVIYFPIRASAKGLGFMPRNIQNVASNPAATVVGDFNNDGLLDFAVGSGTMIQVFLGKGNGTFQPPVNTPATGVAAMVAGDFNGDGNLDLAVIDNGNGNSALVDIFLGNGDGTFAEKWHLGVTNASPINVRVADFNHDGKLDLYVDGQKGGRKGEVYFWILLGNGDGTFSTPVVSEIYLPPGGYGSPAIADLNSDGNLDIAVGGGVSSGKVVRVFLGAGTGYFTWGGKFPVGFTGDSVAAADVDGDGKIDLVTDGVSILLGNGKGDFRQVASVASGGRGSVNLGDFNGDGKLDIAAGSSMLLGNGDGTFRNPVTFADINSTGPIGMGGFVANGQLDLLGLDSQGAVSIFEQHALYFGPNAFNFGSLLIGTTSPPQTATLTDFGPKKLEISSLSITGPNAADFAQKNNCGSSLLSNESCKSEVTFTPSVLGAESASLNVTQQGYSQLSIALSGVGANETFAVTLLPSSLSFPLQLVGTTSQTQDATLTNTGNQPVTISSIAASASFGQTNNCPSTLPVNANCEIEVAFTPTDKGMVNGTLSVTDNATGSPQKVSLSGIGTAVVIAPTGINFGDVKVGKSSLPIKVTLSNLATSSLPITQIAIKGSDPSDFSQTNNCGSSLPPQSKCTITVTFTPTATGSRSANVSITDNDPTSPQTVPLSGDGT
jgi:hypothetical protein